MDFSAEPFNPYHLRPLATINQRVVIDLPGVDPGCLGQNGSALLSRRALIELVRARAPELGLEQVEPGEYPRFLNALLERPGEPAYAPARAIAETFGRRLGWLVASIMRCEKGLTDPLAPWEAGYLRHWREEVRQIVLGGGHAGGQLGQVAARAAQGALEACGLAERQFRPAQYPSYLPLIGAARSLPPGASTPAGAPAARVVADFGGTRAKRAIAYYDAAGRLARLEALPPGDIAALTASGDVARLAARMVAVLAETARRAPAPLDPCILCSVAAYTQDGRPLNIDRGIYTWLNRLAPDIREWFSVQVSQASGQEMSVAFGHDCDLAACALAGSPRTAALMMGSALGVGFTPPGDGFRALARAFAVAERP